MSKITPFLWFNNQAEEAAEFYTSVFKDSSIQSVTRYDAAGAEVSGQAEGSAMTVAFQIEGQDFTALNGGPMFKFTEAISFVVNCEDQAEIDRLWEALSAYPESEQCGWLKDKFGVSWQIVPARLGELLGGDDPKKSQAAMQAMLSMKKMDIAGLQAARDNA